MLSIQVTIYYLRLAGHPVDVCVREKETDGCCLYSAGHGAFYAALILSRVRRRPSRDPVKCELAFHTCTHNTDTHAHKYTYTATDSVVLLVLKHNNLLTAHVTS